MSLRHHRSLPPRQGRLDRLFTFTRVELASARLGSLAIGVQSALDRQGKGCSYYANRHVHAHMLATVRDQSPLAHDRYENLVILYVFRTYNPLLQEATMLQTHEFASDFRDLLKERLEGSTSFPALCGAALKSAVSGFPV